MYVGFMQKALSFSRGLKLEELILRHSLGFAIEDIDREPAAAGVIRIPIPAAGRLFAVMGLEAAQRVPAPDRGEEETTYTGDPTPLENKLNYSWEHPISDIVMGAMNAGLVLRELREHEQVAWQAFPAMVDGTPGLYRLPDSMPAYPLSFSLVAEKPRDSAEA